MTRREQVDNAVKLFIRLDNNIDEKSLRLGINWADEFPVFKKEYFIEKTVEWMKSIVYQEYPGGPQERIITDNMIDEYIKVINN